jgi:uncharacterized membrane protein
MFVTLFIKTAVMIAGLILASKAIEFAINQFRKH